MRPRIAFVARIRSIVAGCTPSEIKIGSISSEVDRKTAIRVPTEITPPANRLEAAAEKPHCGRIPTAAPISGPK